jgi:hypothetical protein
MFSETHCRWHETNARASNIAPNLISAPGVQKSGRVIDLKVAWTKHKA